MNKIMNKQQFLQFVQDYITYDSEAAAYINEFVANGLRQSLLEARERAADMESVVAMSVMKSVKKKEYIEFLKEKLKKWKSRTSLAWDTWSKDNE